MREFTFYLIEEDGFKVELWNHYGDVTEEYLAGDTFVNTTEFIDYIVSTLTHYNYNTVFFMRFRGEKYTCSNRNAVLNILTECGVAI